MSETIRGMNVVIGSDTTGLSAALADVNKKSRDIQSELKQVEKLLKFNPKDTELLAQKQKLLGDQVVTTREKLDRLRSVQEQINDQFKRGEISEGQYRAFQREIVSTEGKLKHFKGQLESTGKQGNVFASKMDNIGKSFQRMGTKLKGIGNTLTTKVTAPLTAAFGLLTAGTQEFRSDLARLSTNAQMAGANIESMNQAMRQMQGVTGELDSNVEGISNLLATGFKGDAFKQVLDELSGAAIKFSDTLKFEGLADGLQETLATGQAVGPFAELLERSGIALEGFNKGLQEAIKNGGEQNYILESLASTGLADVYTQYRKNNEELVKSRESQYELQRALAELGNTLEPFLTKLTQLATSAANAFNKLSPAGQNIVLMLGGLAAAIGPLLSVIGALMKAVGVLAPAIGALTGPIGLATAAIVSLVAAIKWFSGASERAHTETQKQIKAHREQIRTINDLTSEYKELSKKTNKTNEEKERLIELSNQIGEVIPGAITAYDNEGNAIINLNVALVEMVNLKKEEMALRAKDIEQYIKEEERKVKSLEKEREEIDKIYQDMMAFVRDDTEGKKQAAKFTADHTREMSRLNAEINNSTTLIKDLGKEQEELERLSEKVTVEYIKNEIKKQEELKKTAEQEKMAAAEAKVVENKKAQLDEENKRKRIELENEYNQKCFEQSASRLEILEAEKQAELAKAKELGADKADIIAYYEAEISRIKTEEANKRIAAIRQANELERQQDEEAARVIQERLENRLSYEDEWNQRLQQIKDQYRLSRATSQEEEIAIRLEQLERQKQLELAKAEEMGAEKQAILDYYAVKEQELLHKKDEAYRLSTQHAQNSFLSFVEAIGSGSETLSGFVKDMVISVISNLQKSITANALSAKAIAYAMSLGTFGASLSHLATIAAKVLPAVGALEALKAGIRGLAEGGKVIAPTMALIGEGRHDEAVLPLNDKVFGELGRSIAAHMPQPAGASGRPVNINFHGVLIGDELSFKKLAKKILPYQINEKRRMGD